MAAAFIPEVIYISRLFTKQASSVNLPKVTLRVNGVIFLIACVLLATSIIYDVNFLRYKVPIKYGEWETIDWSDFRAIKRPKQTLDGSQNFAFICSEIVSEVTDEKAEVTTLFHPARSYTFNEEMAGKGLLQHELYHLHITEFWSRKIRKQISTLEGKAGKKEIIRLIEKNRRFERAMQYQYDDETYHGYVLGEQRSWQGEIDSCLKKLEGFSNPIVTFGKK